MSGIQTVRTLASICFSLVTLSGVAAQSKNPQRVPEVDLARMPSKHSGSLPRAEFGQPSTETPAKQTHRQRRESRRRNFLPFISDPGKLVEGHQETTTLTIIDAIRIETVEQFPTSFSAAVIIGTVVDAQGFVSQDRTYVYSDFRIRIDEILRQDSNAHLLTGGEVTALRPGAAVYFPSGHIRRFVVFGHGMPKVGAQYVFFFWRPDADLPEYEVHEGGAYELKNGKVYPLDNEGAKFEGMDASQFLGQVKAEIAASKN